MAIIGGINLGELTNYLFYFADGRNDAAWQGDTKGYVGDVAINGAQASLRSVGIAPFAGVIYTSASTLGPWENIINLNMTQAIGETDEITRVTDLRGDLIRAIQQITALPATPGFTNVDSVALNGLNTQNGLDEIFVINITSGLNFSTKINITGDPGDIFILRWDEDGNPENGYQGQVKPERGGAIVPRGGLTAANFINIAGDINALGGGTAPAPPYPKGPRYNNGQGALVIGGSDFDGGGFFTGYWLTTGSPTTYDRHTALYYGPTGTLTNAVFVGGWYTLSTRLRLHGGTSGVYIGPNATPPAEPSIEIEKYVSVDSGLTWVDADTPPGPELVSPRVPQFKLVVTNTGNVTLFDIAVNDTTFGLVPVPTTTLDPGEKFEIILIGSWQAGQHVNEATVTACHSCQQVMDSDRVYFCGTEAVAEIDVEKQVSADGGLTWEDADVPPGPTIQEGTPPMFRFIVTNLGTVPLTNITLVDSVLGPINTPVTTLAAGDHFEVIVTGTWQVGEHVNEATASGKFDNKIYTDTDLAHYLGVRGPSIEVVKFVSVDNGLTWHDANIPPGPFLPPGTTPLFKFVVTNNGGTQLTDVTVTDSVIGLIATIPSMIPGESLEFIRP